jgi:hypothetical protein
MDNNKSLYVFISTVMAERIISYFSLGNSMYGILYNSLNEFFANFEKMYSNNMNLNFFNNFFDFDNIYNNNIFGYIKLFFAVAVLIILPIVMFFYGKTIIKHYRKVLLYLEKLGHCTLKIHELDTIDNITKYIMANPSCFKNFTYAEKGDDSLISCIMKDNLNSKSSRFYNNDFNENLTTLCDMVIPQENNKIIICDTKNGIHGFMSFDKNEIEINDYSSPSQNDNNNSNNANGQNNSNNAGNKKSEGGRDFTFNYPSVEISLKVGNINEINNYLEKIKEFVEENMQNKIHSYNVMKDNVMIKEIGCKTDIVYDKHEKLYIDSFFHPEKGELWNYIHKIHHEPSYFTNYGQPAVCNLLLHGPPGTGKSSFAYRIAKALGREIVTVDLRDFDKKRDIIGIFDNPEEHVSWKSFKSSSCVYVLDEFDISVKYLYAKQQKQFNKDKKFERILKKQIMNNSKLLEKSGHLLSAPGVNNVNGPYDNVNHPQDQNQQNTAGTGTGIDLSNYSFEDSDSDYDSDSSSESVPDSNFNIKKKDDEDKDNKDDKDDKDKDDKDKDNKDKDDKDKDDKEKEDKEKKDKKKKKKKKQDILKKYAKSDELCLKDLLTILQGPIPTEGRIIIGTTNDYEGIKDLCPELVRPGRMTPILFDNLNIDSFNEICEYYFATKSTFDFDGTMKVPPSEITELCLKCKINNKSFEYFIEQVIEKNK